MNQELLSFRARRNHLREKVGRGWLLLYKGGEYFNENLYYLTGIDSFFTLSLISLETEQEYVFTNSIELPETQAATDIQNVESCDTQEFMFKLTSLVKFHNIWILYCDYGLHSRSPLPAEIIDCIRLKIPQIVIKDLPKALLSMRMIKEPGEIQTIKESIVIVENLFDTLPDIIKPGLPEAELASVIFKELVRHGFNRFYDIFIASGLNSAIPFYRSNSSILPPDHVVLIDICAARCNYVIDITRTFPTSGEFPARFQKIYSVITQVHQHLVASVREGLSLHELSEFAKASFKASGFDDFYLNKVGHFVGLAPDDPGCQETPFQKGMALTIEPGLYLSDAGLRIEDTIFVTK